MRPLQKSVEDPEVGWGTPSVDQTVASDPSTPEAQAITQATQTANETARATAAVSQLPPPPVFSEIITGQRITPAWSIWLQQLYRRVGGASALDQSSLEAMDAMSDLQAPSVVEYRDDQDLQPVADLQRRVADLETLLALVLAEVPADVLRRSSKQIGFFGAPLASKPAAITSATVLTSAFGTTGTALADVGAAFNQATLNSNFKAVVDKTANTETRIANLYSRLQALGLIS